MDILWQTQVILMNFNILFFFNFLNLTVLGLGKLQGQFFFESMKVHPGKSTRELESLENGKYGSNTTNNSPQKK